MIDTPDRSGNFEEKNKIIPEKISEINTVRDFPGGPVAKSPPSQYRGPGFNPWSENEIPHVTTNCLKGNRHGKAGFSLEIMLGHLANA